MFRNHGAKNCTSATQKAQDIIDTTISNTCRNSRHGLLLSTIGDPDRFGADGQSFHFFLRVSRSGMALHVGDTSPFWTQTAPQLAHYNAAIKRALIALGAAYSLYKIAGPKSAGRNGHPVPQEAFMLQQYSLAIRELQHQILSNAPESKWAALICSLIFVCLENLRSNPQGAISHLRSGIRLIESSIDLAKLYCPPDQPHPTSRPMVPLMSDTDLRGLVNYFHLVERCHHLFAHDLPLQLGSRLSALVNFDAGYSLPKRFTSLGLAHSARMMVQNKVMNRDWESTIHRGDPKFWSLETSRHEHTTMYRQTKLVEGMYEDFLRSSYVPSRGTREYISCCHDMVQLKSTRAVVELMPIQPCDQKILQESSSFQDIIQGMIFYGEQLLEAKAIADEEIQSTLEFTIECSFVPPLYYAYLYATSPEWKERALQVLSRANVREGPWDSQALAQLLRSTSNIGENAGASSTDDQSSQNWGGDQDPMALLSTLSIED